MVEFLLEVYGVSKFFYEVVVLVDGCLQLKCGSVYVLCGGNGVGKLIFLVIIMGLLWWDGGEICFKGQLVDFYLLVEVLQYYIVIIMQEFLFIFGMSVVENFYFGCEFCVVGFCVNICVMEWQVQVLLDCL